MARRRLGEILLEAGALTEAQLAQALARQQKTGGRLGGVLVEAGLVSEAHVVNCLSQQLGLPAARFPLEVPRALLDAIPVEVCEKHGVFPLASQRDAKGEILTVAMVDPTNIEIIDAIQFRSGRRVIPTIAGETETMAAIRRHYYGEKPRTDVAPQGTAQFAGHEIDLTEPAAEDDIPVVTGTLSPGALAEPVPPPVAPEPPMHLPPGLAERPPWQPPTRPPEPAPPLPPPPATARGTATTTAPSPPDSGGMFGASGGFLGAEEDELAPRLEMGAAASHAPPVLEMVAPAAERERGGALIEVVAEPSGPVAVVSAPGPAHDPSDGAITLRPPDGLLDLAAFAPAEPSPTATQGAVDVGAIEIDMDVELEPIAGPPAAPATEPANAAGAASEEILELDSSAIIVEADGMPARTKTTTGPPPIPPAPPTPPTPRARTMVGPPPTPPAAPQTPAPAAPPPLAASSTSTIPTALQDAPFCPDCGATRVARAKFCPMCGCSFTGVSRAKGAPPTDPPTTKAALPAIAHAPPRPPLTIDEIEALEGIRTTMTALRSSAAGAADENAALRGESTNGVGLSTTQLSFVRSQASTPDDVEVLAGAVRAFPAHLVAARAGERDSPWGAVDDRAALIAGATPPLLEVVPLSSPPAPAALVSDWRDVAERPIPRKDTRTDVAVIPRARETFMPSPDEETSPPALPLAEPQLSYTPAAVPDALAPIVPAPWAAFAPPPRAPDARAAVDPNRGATLDPTGNPTDITDKKPGT